MNNEKILDLQTLKNGIGNLSSNVSAFYAEAATVCLIEEGHKDNAPFILEYTKKYNLQIVWTHFSKAILNSWKDRDVATEFGAVGVSLLIVEMFTPYTVWMQSRKKTGFDYWLRPKKLNKMPFAENACLEVSGIRRGRSADIGRRLRKKVDRFVRFDEAGALIVIIVEFGTPRARVFSNGRRSENP